MTASEGVHERSSEIIDVPPIVESRVSLDGLATRVLEVTGDGSPILMLHGFSDSADSWRPVLSELAAQSRHAIAVDLPGHGAASRLPSGRVVPRLDSFTAACVRHFGDDDAVVLAGNSLGGLLALRAAQRHDLPLRAVVGVAPAGLAHTRRLDRTYTWIRRLQPVLQTMRVLPVPGHLVRARLAHAFQARAEGRADPVIACRYASHYRGLPDVLRLFPIMVALGEETRDDPVRLEKIGVPVAVLLGGRDRLVSSDTADVLLATLPDARVTVLEDCGHCPQVQRPVDVAALLADVPTTR